MKFTKYLICLAAAGAAFTACDNDFDRPPVIVPEATIRANTAISEFKEMYWDIAQANSSTTIGLNAEGDSIILGGRIISSDSCGNVYQQIYLADESGALNIRVHGYDLYESYRFGQELRINVTGLLVGGYGKVMQIGTLYNGSIGGMEPEVLAARAQRNGLPQLGSVVPLTVTLGELEQWKNDKEKLIQYQCQLVKIEGVSFAGGGTDKWSSKPGQTGYTNTKLSDSEGHSIDVRTSNKCTFANQLLPKGKGTVIAILGYFNTNWQLTFMCPDTDCIGFDPSQGGDTPTPGPTGETVFTETFSGGQGDFTIDNVKMPEALTYVWNHAADYKCMKASAFANNQGYASESILVSPEIDLTKAKAPVLVFDQALNHFADMAAAKQEATAVIREAGSKEWTTLTGAAYPDNLSWSFVSTGSIDLKAWAGKKVNIGFRYVSTDAKAGTWEVKNVKVID